MIVKSVFWALDIFSRLEVELDLVEVSAVVGGLGIMWKNQVEQLLALRVHRDAVQCWIYLFRWLGMIVLSLGGYVC